LSAVSRASKVAGESGEEQERIKRIGGGGDGSVCFSSIWCIVGTYRWSERLVKYTHELGCKEKIHTAVYQLALYLIKSFQNSEAENLGGTMTVPPDLSGARKPARRP